MQVDWSSKLPLHETNVISCGLWFYWHHVIQFIFVKESQKFQHMFFNYYYFLKL